MGFFARDWDLGAIAHVPEQPVQIELGATWEEMWEIRLPPGSYGATQSSIFSSALMHLRGRIDDDDPALVLSTANGRLTMTRPAPDLLRIRPKIAPADTADLDFSPPEGSTLDAGGFVPNPVDPPAGEGVMDCFVTLSNTEIHRVFYSRVQTLARVTRP